MIRFTLDNIAALLALLDDPQDKLSFIHIAGTNGKGSVAAFLSSILKEAGFRVGTYTSPAVFSEEEVIRIGGRKISKKAYKEGMERIDEACGKLPGDRIPSLFEMQTALAFLYFAENHCDIVVLEAGMGGGMDATNIVKNTRVCVFTPISMDHTEYLGNSLHNIANNKAGILKKGCVAVSARQEKEASKVLRERADAMNVPFYEMDPADLSGLTVRDIRSEEGQRFSISLHKFNAAHPGNRPGTFPEALNDLEIPLRGLHQCDNAALAVLAALSLVADGPDGIPGPVTRITEKAIRNGLHKTMHPGRFEILRDLSGISLPGKKSGFPVVILDGAHNIGGAKVLADTLRRCCGKSRIIGIAGMLKDKDHDAVMGEVAPLCGMLFTVSTAGERGYPSEALAKTAVRYNPNVTSIGGIEEALELAVLSAKKNDVILVFGTLSLLGKAKRYLTEKI